MRPCRPCRRLFFPFSTSPDEDLGKNGSGRQALAVQRQQLAQAVRARPDMARSKTGRRARSSASLQRSAVALPAAFRNRWSSQAAQVVGGAGVVVAVAHQAAGADVAERALQPPALSDQSSVEFELEARGRAAAGRVPRSVPAAARRTALSVRSSAPVQFAQRPLRIFEPGPPPARGSRLPPRRSADAAAGARPARRGRRTPASSGSSSSSSSTVSAMRDAEPLAQQVAARVAEKLQQLLHRHRAPFRPRRRQRRGRRSAAAAASRFRLPARRPPPRPPRRLCRAGSRQRRRLGRQPLLQRARSIPG